VVGHLNAQATRATILGVVHSHRVGTPDADESTVLVRKHRNELATAYTVTAPNDHETVIRGWRIIYHCQNQWHLGGHSPNFSECVGKTSPIDPHRVVLNPSWCRNFGSVPTLSQGWASVGFATSRFHLRAVFVSKPATATWNDLPQQFLKATSRESQSRDLVPAPDDPTYSRPYCYSLQSCYENKTRTGSSADEALKGQCGLSGFRNKIKEVTRHTRNSGRLPLWRARYWHRSRSWTRTAPPNLGS
jgi:hypothetical protein